MRSIAAALYGAIFLLVSSAASAISIDPNPFWIFNGAAAAAVSLIETTNGLPAGPAGEPAVVQLGSVSEADLTLVFQVRVASVSPPLGPLDVTIRDAGGVPIPIVGAGTVLLVQTDLEAQFGANPGNVVFNPVDDLGQPTMIDGATDYFFVSFDAAAELIGGLVEIFDQTAGATGSALIVPEPGSLALLLAGAAGLALARRREALSR